FETRAFRLTAHAEPMAQHGGNVLTPNLGRLREPGHVLAVGLDVDGARCRLAAVRPFGVWSPAGRGLDHVLDVVDAPTGARQDAADHERTVMARIFSLIVSLQQARDRELEDNALEFFPVVDARGLALAHPLYHLASLVHRRGKRRRGSFAVTADAKLDDQPLALTLTAPAAVSRRSDHS